jgi:hypothetical protein
MNEASKKAGKMLDVLPAFLLASEERASYFERV